MSKTKSTLFAVAIASIAMMRCSSDGQSGGQGEEPVNAAADGLNGASNNASLDGDNQKAKGKKGAAAEGAAMNNALGGEDFSGANGTAPGNAAPANGGANILTNNLSGSMPNAAAVPLNQSAPINTGTANAALTGNAAPPSNTPSNAAVPTNSAAAPASPATPSAPVAPAATVVNWDKMNASPFANTQMNWPGKGKVKYITRKATKHASPNGPVVGEFNVGNHPLVYQDGNWVELSNGTFVKGDSTTDKPIGYERSPAH